MWDELSLSTIMVAAGVGAVLAAAIAFLPRSRLRLSLISFLALLPVWLVGWALMMTVYDVGFDESTFAWFIVFTMLLLPPWAIVTLLPFNLVRRWREIRAWEL